MYVHALASQDYITVSDANGKKYPISPNGGNNASMSMCNSYSIDKYDVERNLKLEHILPGDMFIHGGYPGHVAIVLDVIKNDHDIQFMLGQGWLPALDFHVTYDKNMKDVWFSVNEFKKKGVIQLHTEHTYYDFKVSELKRWKNR